MNKNKKPFILLAFALLLIGFLFIKHNRGEFLNSQQGIEVKVASTTPPVETAVVSDETSADAKDNAWAVFEAYLANLKAHNITAVKNLSYKQSATCADKAQKSACLARMDELYAIIKDFKESDFTHIGFDQKQIILYTDWKLEESDIASGYAREMIYFTRSEDGSPKVLFMTQPSAITYTLKTPDMSKAEITQRLDQMTKDTDQDTLDDQVETCLYMGVDEARCVKSDPEKKDTDGDGYWDSTEAYMKL